MFSWFNRSENLKKYYLTDNIPLLEKAEEKLENTSIAIEILDQNISAKTTNHDEINKIDYLTALPKELITLILQYLNSQDLMSLLRIKNNKFYQLVPTLDIPYFKELKIIDKNFQQALLKNEYKLINHPLLKWYAGLGSASSNKIDKIIGFICFSILVGGVSCIALSIKHATAKATTGYEDLLADLTIQLNNQKSLYNNKISGLKNGIDCIKKTDANEKYWGMNTVWSFDEKFLFHEPYFCEETPLPKLYFLWGTNWINDSGYSPSHMIELLNNMMIPFTNEFNNITKPLLSVLNEVTANDTLVRGPFNREHQHLFHMMLISGILIMSLSAILGLAKKTQNYVRNSQDKLKKDTISFFQKEKASCYYIHKKLIDNVSNVSRNTLL